MINRKDIKGFEFKILNFYFEFVFIKYMLKVFAISKPRAKTILRLEV